MSQGVKTFKGIPQAIMRRMRSTPTYFFLIWRWGTWLYALAVYLATPGQLKAALPFLVLTFVHSLVITLYAPVFQILLPGMPGLSRGNKAEIPGQDERWVVRRQRRRFWGRSRLRPLAAYEEADILAPVIRTRSRYWNFAIYGLDVVICGLVVYFTAPHWLPPFGIGSPFYRYGLSAILIAAFSYRYAGGLLAMLGYSFFILLGAYFPPPGTAHFVPHIQDLLQSLVDAPFVAIIAAYTATLLNEYSRNKRREQDHVRRQRSLLRFGETLVMGASDRQHLLQQSSEEIRRGGHFEHLVAGLIANVDGKEMGRHVEEVKNLVTEIDDYVESGRIEIEETTESISKRLRQVAESGEKLIAFERLNRGGQEGTASIARLYVPIFKEGRVYMVLGVESTRQTPFEWRHEEFLTIVGAQLVVALENLRLTEQMVNLAAEAERGRIAREIHDGIAQLIYMMRFNTETCTVLVERIANASEEEAQMLAPLAELLRKLMTISNQALFETRDYMFTLKPMIHGMTTLTQMLTNQLHEFEVISGLPVRLKVDGIEEHLNGHVRRAHKIAQVGTAIFRITQEALMNAYKHADATQIEVSLHHQPDSVAVEIRDNGKGLDRAAQSNGHRTGEEESMPIYSGRGIPGMRERAEELGGTLEVTQTPGSGLSVRACIPT